MTGETPRKAPGISAGRLRLALLLVAAIACPGLGAHAQSLNFGDTSSKIPIEIFADQGIEWQQDLSVIVARGNARAIRGEVEVTGDSLRAYYREGASGNEIWRLDAEGGVKIASTGETAFGEKAVYDVDNAVLVLTGGKVKLVTSTDEVTADKQIEYWENKQMAVARGNAVATREDRRIWADVLVAYVRSDQAGKSKVVRIDAFDRVKIVTAQETATADRGVYNVESGIATLTGSVKIMRGPNVLDGCTAEVNLNTGISKLFGCSAATPGNKRVYGVIQPGEVKKNKP